MWLNDFVLRYAVLKPKRLEGMALFALGSLLDLPLGRSIVFLGEVASMDADGIRRCCYSFFKGPVSYLSQGGFLHETFRSPSFTASFWLG